MEYTSRELNEIANVWNRTIRRNAITVLNKTGYRHKQTQLGVHTLHAVLYIGNVMDR